MNNDNINMLAQLQKSLFQNEIDSIITLGNKVTLEIEDMKTKTTIAVVKGDTLEEAYANLLGTLANHTRMLKTYEGLSKL